MKRISLLVALLLAAGCNKLAVEPSSPPSRSDSMRRVPKMEPPPLSERRIQSGPDKVGPPAFARDKNLSQAEIDLALKWVSSRRGDSTPTLKRKRRLSAEVAKSDYKDFFAGQELEQESEVLAIDITGNFKIPIKGRQGKFRDSQEITVFIRSDGWLYGFQCLGSKQ